MPDKSGPWEDYAPTPAKSAQGADSGPWEDFASTPAKTEVKGNFPAMRPEESHWYDPVVNPIREGAVGRAFHLDTITEAEKQRNPELRDRQLLRLSEGNLENAPTGVPSVILGPLVPGIQVLDLARSVPGATGNVAKGLMREGAGFFGSMSTPENIGIMAAGGELPEIAKAAASPVVKKALLGSSTIVNGYFTAQMAKGASQSLTEAADAYKKGDYTTMAVKLGRTGMEGLMAALGVHGLAKTAMIAEPRLKYEARQTSKPLSQQDPGIAKGTTAAPEVLPTQPGVGATPDPTTVTPNPAPPNQDQGGVPRRLKGEPPDQYRKRVLESGPKKTTPTSTAIPATPTPTSQAKPAEAPKPVAPAETPEQQLAKVEAKPAQVAETKTPVADTKPAITDTPSAPAGKKRGGRKKVAKTPEQEIERLKKQIADKQAVKVVKSEATATQEAAKPEVPAVAKTETPKETPKHTPVVAEPRQGQQLSESERNVIRLTKEGKGVEGYGLLTDLVESGLSEDEANDTIHRMMTRGLIRRIEDSSSDGDRFARTPEGSASLNPPKYTPVVAAQPPAKPVGNPLRPPIAGKYVAPASTSAVQPAQTPSSTTAPAVQSAVTPAVYNPAAVAGPEHTGIVNAIIGDMAKRGVDDLTFQPLDGNGKPLGEPIQINDNSDPEKIAQEIAARGAKGIFYDHPELAKTWKMLDAFKLKQEVTPVRTETSGLPKEGDDVVFDSPIAKYPAGTEFMFAGKDPESGMYMLWAPNSGNPVRVSLEDLARRKPPEIERGFAGLEPGKSGERGSFSLRSVGSKAKPSVLNSNYSGIGGSAKDALVQGLSKVKKGAEDLQVAAENVFVRGLSRIENESERVHGAAVKKATSGTQASILVRQTMPLVAKAIGGSDLAKTEKDFSRALIENRLRDLEDFWNDTAAASLQASDEELQASLGKWMFNLLKQIKYKASSPANTVASLVSNKNFDVLRDVLFETFTKAADNVASVMPEAEFGAFVTNPRFKDGLKIWKELAEKEIRDNHAQNEGVISERLGKYFEAYYPLIPIRSEGKPASTSGISASAPAYSTPRNVANRFATGLAKDYNPSIEALIDRLTKNFNANNKSGLLNTMRDEGLLVDVPYVKGKQGPVPATILFDGKDYPAKLVYTTNPKTLITPDKGVTHVPGKKSYTADWAYDELKPIMEKKDLELYDPTNLVAKITDAAIFGPIVGSIHAYNLVGVLVARTPFLSQSILGKTIENTIPFAKRVVASLSVTGLDQETKTGDMAAAKDLIEMSKIGVLPEWTGTATFSRQEAALTGAHFKPFGVEAILRGPHGIDIRARLKMYRAQKRMNPGASDLEQYLAINQLGNYTRILMGSAEKFLKGPMRLVAPFATATTTRIRNASNTILGTGPQMKDTPYWKRQLNLNSALGVAIVTTLAAKEYSGDWWWNQPSSQLGKIKVKPEDRNTPAGRMLCGDPDSGECFINIAEYSQLAENALRISGISPAIKTDMAGGSADQIADAVLTEWINTVASPAIGPPVKALSIAVTGRAPYLTGIKDPQGMPGAQFFPTASPQPPGMKGWMKQHVGAPLITINSLFQNLGEATGLTDGWVESEGHVTPGSFGANLIVPNSVSITYPEKHEKFLERQQKSEQTAAEKRMP